MPSLDVLGKCSFVGEREGKVPQCWDGLGQKARSRGEGRSAVGRGPKGPIGRGPKADLPTRTHTQNASHWDSEQRGDFLLSRCRFCVRCCPRWAVASAFNASRAAQCSRMYQVLGSNERAELRFMRARWPFSACSEIIR